MRKSNIKKDKLIRNKYADLLTVKFLESKFLKIYSENDYIHRLRILVRILIVMPIYLFIFCVTCYYSLVIKLNNFDKSQLILINTFLLFSAINIFIFSSLFIYFYFQRLNKYSWLIASIYNLFYISYVILIFSIVFIFKWSHILEKLTSTTLLLNFIKNNWFSMLLYAFQFLLLTPLFKIFLDIKLWSNEWDKIQWTKNVNKVENAFIFKSWATKEELACRLKIRVIAIFGMVIANVLILMSQFSIYDVSIIAYLFFFTNVFIYIFSYFFPFKKISLIFYGFVFLIYLIQMFYALFSAQMYGSDDWTNYINLIIIIPWLFSLKALMSYYFIMRDYGSLKSIAIEEFNNDDEFEEYVNEISNNKDKLVTTDQVDENKIDYSTNKI